MFNTTSLLCDCQLTWLIDQGATADEEDNESSKPSEPWPKRNIVGTAECRHPQEWTGKSLLHLPSNVSCGSWPRPLIVANPQSATGLRGQNVSFECQARCQEDYIDCHMSIHWRKNGRVRITLALRDWLLVTIHTPFCSFCTRSQILVLLSAHNRTKLQQIDGGVG